MIYDFFKLLKSTTDRVANEQLNLSKQEFNALCKDKEYKKNLALEVKDIRIISEKLSDSLAEA